MGQSLVGQAKQAQNKTAVLPDERNLPVFLFICLLAFSFAIPSLSFGAERRPKPPATPASAAPIQKDIAINDANLPAAQKRVEELVKKGDLANALQIMLKMHDYTKEVLSVTKTIKAQYEKAVNDPSTSQNDKEEIFIKLKALDQLIPRYTGINTTATFNLGYLYAKRGDSEKARKYLVDFLEKTPFSSGPDSKWMKAKTLLLELYSLEGEF